MGINFGVVILNLFCYKIEFEKLNLVLIVVVKI